MNDFMNEADVLAMADLEDEVAHSVSAGLDWGDRVGEFFRQPDSYVDGVRLCEVLTDGLGDIFDDREIRGLVESFQDEVARLVEQKLASGREG